MPGEQTLILVVEDDPQIMRLMQLVLGQEGYDVSLVESGEEALDFLKDNSPSLVLLDNRLPGIDGFTTCQRIRTFSEVPVVMVTVMDDLINKLHGIEIGADFYITKPFMPSELVARVKAILRRSAMSPPRFANCHDSSTE